MQRPRGRGRGVKGRKPKDKNLEIQHWLELVDSKHRYGSNLKYYHRTWWAEETTDNFFRWFVLQDHRVHISDRMQARLWSRKGSVASGVSQKTIGKGGAHLESFL